MSTTLTINLDDLLYCRGVESERVEFKESWNAQNTGPQVLRTICAFANDYHNLNGGYVVIGVGEREGRAELPPAGLSADNLDAAQKWLRGKCGALDPPYFPVLSPETVDRLIPANRRVSEDSERRATARRETVPCDRRPGGSPGRVCPRYFRRWRPTVEDIAGPSVRVRRAAHLLPGHSARTSRIRCPVGAARRGALAKGRSQVRGGRARAKQTRTAATTSISRSLPSSGPHGSPGPVPGVEPNLFRHPRRRR